MIATAYKTCIAAFYLKRRQNMHKTARIRLLGFMILCLLIVGCAPRPVFQLDPRFYEVDLGRIYILPVVDKSWDKSADINLNAPMQKRIYKRVKKKGYDVSIASTFSEAGNVTADTVAMMSQQEISNLGPADATTLLIVYVKVISQYLVVNYDFRVSAEAELIHKPSKTMLWKGYGYARGRQEGLISGLSAPAVRRNAFHDCVNSMMKGLPKITSPNKSRSFDKQPQTPPPSAPSSPPPQPQASTESARDEQGIINIATDPPGAKIFIDGEFKGQTPAEVSLTTGTYQLFLQRQLYEPYKESVNIEKGQTKTLNIRLSPERGTQ